VVGCVPGREGGFDFDDNDDNGNNNGTSLDQRTGSEDGTGQDRTGPDWGSWLCTGGRDSSDCHHDLFTLFLTMTMTTRCCEKWCEQKGWGFNIYVKRGGFII
jgi:hypothetical protein